MQAFKHSRLTENKDMYSVATFVLLGLSLVMFLFFTSMSFIEETLKALYDHDSIVVDWFQEHASVITVCRTISRIMVGYLCQNLAFLVNTERWVVILQQGNKRAFIRTIYLFILSAFCLTGLSLAEWSYFDLLMALV